MPPSDEGMRLLRECHAMLNECRALLKAHLNSGASGGGVADDRDLDSQWGDEEIKKDPKRWTGESHMGRRMSQCDPAFLDEYAGFKDWASGRDEEEAKKLEGEEREKKLKYAKYGRKSSARARGWAARLRAGWKPPAPSASEDPDFASWT